MRLRLAPTVSSISGSVGALTFQTAFGRTSARTKPRYTPSNTPAQQAVRAVYRSIRTSYETLPLWIIGAQRANLPDPITSAWSWFASRNLVAPLAHGGHSLTPPHPTIPQPQNLERDLYFDILPRLTYDKPYLGDAYTQTVFHITQIDPPTPNPYVLDSRGTFPVDSGEYMWAPGTPIWDWCIILIFEHTATSVFSQSNYIA